MILQLVAIIVGLLILVVVLVLTGKLRWAALVSDEELVDRGLIVLLHRHSDFIPGLRWVPRWLLAFLGPQPRKLLGSAPADSHFDIPPNGTWVVCWPLYFALKTKGGWHWRIGFRPDYEAIPGGDVDYYELDTIWPRNLDK